MQNKSDEEESANTADAIGILRGLIGFKPNKSNIDPTDIINKASDVVNNENVTISEGELEKID